MASMKKLIMAFLLASWLMELLPGAEVRYLELGTDGVHHDYTAGGTLAGIGSASYDYWISRGPWNAPPASGFGDQSADNEGAVLLAFNPYTGEVFTQIAAPDQYLNPLASYSGGGHSSLGSAAEFLSRGGIYPTAATHPLPLDAFSDNTIAFTTELRPDGAGAWVVGLYAQASEDGAILGRMDPGHAGIATYNPHFLQAAEEVGSAGSFSGSDIRVYCGYIGWGGAAWMGQFGGAGEKGIGFELDGHLGWARVLVSGDRAGLILLEYYFEGNEFRRLPADYKFAVSSHDGGDTLVFKWKGFTDEVYSVVHSDDPAANPDPSVWPAWPGLQGLSAESPLNRHAVGRPPGSRRFFALVAEPAPPVFYDDLESGPGDWVAIVNDPEGATNWELGTPAASTGPLTGADDSTNAWSTNLGNYGPESDISLRSPVIDLTGIEAAVLSFAAYRDADVEGDRAEISFLDGQGLSPLGRIFELEMGTIDSDFVRQEIEVVPEALGQRIIIEFRFISDSTPDAYSGLTVDNVMVSARPEN